MERERPQPPMEVLDADRPPGMLERWVAPLLTRRGVQLGAALTALLVGGYVVAAPGSGSAPRADDQAAPVPAAPPAGSGGGSDQGPDGAGPWRISEDIAVRYTRAGRTVTFVAVNAGFVARDPRDLQVETSYLGGLASSYAFGCVGGERTPRGFRPRRGLVEPGDRIVVQCPDTVRLNGQPSRLPPEVIDVVLRPRGAREPASDN